MNFIKHIMSFIFSGLGLIILAIIGAIGIIGMFFLFSSAQIWLFGEKDYLLFITNNINFVSVIALGLLVVHFLFFIKYKFTKKKIDEEEVFTDEMYEEDIDDDVVYIKEDSKMGIFMVRVIHYVVLIDDTLETIKKMRISQFIQKNFKITYIVAIIIIIYCGFTSYAVLYENSIKISSPLAPFGETYKYSDIENIEVGVKKVYKDEYEVFYTLKFNDDRTVNLLNGSTDDWEDEKSIEDIVMDIDKKLKAQGVSKSVDKNNFEKFAKGLDKKYVRDKEKLFE